MSHAIVSSVSSDHNYPIFPHYHSSCMSAVDNCKAKYRDSNLSMSYSNQQDVRINLRRMDLSAFINYRP
jgi:hypothetical protein